MPFVAAAKAKIRQLPANDPTRIVLEFMLKHAVGIQNAKSWRMLSDELEDHAIHMTREQFQQTILKSTREGDIFIGSNDHGPGRGYFLIQDKGDASTMQDFYEKRIAAEEAHLTNLKRLISAEFGRNENAA